MTPTLQTEYKERVVPALKEKFGYANIHQVPRVEKVVINTCIGKDPERKQAADYAVEEIRRITGQQPVITKSKRAISNFKLRAGEPLGAMVTLRSSRMYEFLERLIKTALPRVRDFRGVSRKAFDGRGNYCLGVQEQSIFPEIELDQVKRNLGFDVVIVTSAKTDEEAMELLAQLGMPFRKPPAKKEEAAVAGA